MAVSVEDVFSRTRGFFHDDINQLRHALFLGRFARSLQLWYADVHFRPGGSVGFYGHVQQRAGASAHAEAAAADRFPHSTQEEADEEHEQIVKRARAA